jgi:L-fuconolactonase
MLGIIDSHQHFWKVGLFDYPWMSPDLDVLYQDHLPPALEPVLRESGVSQTVLVQASNSLEETRWLLDLADRFPFIAGVVGWVDLTSSNIAGQLDEFVAHPKFKGVRHLVESEPSDDWLVQPEVLDGFRVLASYGIPYDMLVHTRHLKHVVTVAKVCPELSIVVDHLAKPPIEAGEIDEWSREIGRVAENRNVSCKISGLVTEADVRNWTSDDLRPYVYRAVEHFGAGRLIFGSDHPVCLLAASYKQVLDSALVLLSQLGDASIENIFRRNAINFYKLGESSEQGLV